MSEFELEIGKMITMRSTGYALKSVEVLDKKQTPIWALC